MRYDALVGSYLPVFHRLWNSGNDVPALNTVIHEIIRLRNLQAAELDPAVALAAKSIEEAA